MFAIAILDKRTFELKLFVDRLGEKPLYWFMHEGEFFYSSEVVPLLESKIASMTLDVSQVPSYLKFGFVLDPYTIIKDIYRIASGSFTTFSLTDMNLKQTRYWSVSSNQESLPNPISALKSNFKEISETICQGEATVGIALSGGIDSKLVAKLAISNGNTVQAITIGYTDKSRHDETFLASLSAKELGIKSYIKRISPIEAARSFKEVCSIMDEPVGDISSINYLALFDFAREKNIKVLLMGHGSDELLMGYAWLNKAVERANVRASTLLGDFRFRNYARLLQNPFSKSKLGSLSQMLSVIRENLFTLAQISHDYVDFSSGRESVDFYKLSPSTKKRVILSEKLRDILDLQVLNDRSIPISKNSQDFWILARYQILNDYLRLNGLLQLDKISMSKSIEVRNPLVDFELVETVLRSNWQQSRLPLKSQLRAADGLPMSKILENVSKRGFSPPTRLWYRALSSFYSEELRNPRSISLGVFPKAWGRYFIHPFNWSRMKSPIWFDIVVMEMWIRETERRVGAKFKQNT
jgi:asparagine synthase (glutamine-hydrolysing)